jgi:hypothetical protein
VIGRHTRARLRIRLLPWMGGGESGGRIRVQSGIAESTGSREGRDASVIQDQLNRLTAIGISMPAAHHTGALGDESSRNSAF